ADLAVARAFEDLFGDWVRKGGELNRSDVSLLAVVRGLSAIQVSDLIGHLESAGVELTEPRTRPESAEGGWAAAYGVRRSEWRDLDPLALYFDEIGRYPLLTAQQEVELWSLIVDGNAAQKEIDLRGEDQVSREVRQLAQRSEAGRRAWAELVCCNLRLVVS